MSETKIGWTDTTWNPITGCDRISPGCDNCYALTLASRLKAMGSPRYQTDGQPPRSGPGFGVTLHADKLEEPLRWRKPRRVFVNSMSDLFHKDISSTFITDVFDVMARADQHVFQVLTKRPRRMQDYLSRWWGDGEPPPNIWLGVSVENQQWADTRIPWLLKTPAAVRFLSVEPMLEPLDLRPGNWLPPLGGGPKVNLLRPWETPGPSLDWVIVGGESGSNRRPFDKDWARSLRDQCQAAGVPFFLKQGSAYKQGQDRVLDGRTWEEFPDG